MISEAEKNNELKKGGLIVENTSGNTGAGIAMVASVKDYKAILTIPDKMSQEKIDLLKKNNDIFFLDFTNSYKSSALVFRTVLSILT